MSSPVLIGSEVIRVAIFFQKPPKVSELDNYLIWGYFRKMNHPFMVSAVTPKEIVMGVLVKKGFDVLILPGGDAEDQQWFLGQKGKQKVIEFVRDYGKSVLGICAGSYLCLSSMKSYLKGKELEKFKTYESKLMIDKVIDRSTSFWHFGMIKDYTSYDLRNWNRGVGVVDIEYTKEGMKLFQIPEDEKNVKCYYANGSLFYKINDKLIGNHQKTTVISHFSSEKARKSEGKGKMVNTPAVLLSRFGKGKVMVSSAHAESNKSDGTVRKHLKRFIMFLASNK